MTPSPVGLLDNCSRRSSSPVQLSSEVGVVVSDPAEGRPGEATSVRSLGVCRPDIRSLLNRRRGRRLRRNQLVELRPGRLRVGAIRMGGQERAPSLGRLRPLSDSIVQVLVEIRCGDGVDRGSVCFRPCGREGLGDEDADVIEPSKLRDAFEARRVRIYGRKRQCQKEHVFPSTKHAPPD